MKMVPQQMMCVPYDLLFTTVYVVFHSSHILSQQSYICSVLLTTLLTPFHPPYALIL